MKDTNMSKLWFGRRDCIAIQYLSTVKKNKAFLLSQSDLNNPFDKTFNFMIKSLSKSESNINCKKFHKSYMIQILIEN